MIESTYPISPTKIYYTYFIIVFLLSNCSSYFVSAFGLLSSVFWVLCNVIGS